jgi:hypothetical protein
LATGQTELARWLSYQDWYAPHPRTGELQPSGSLIRQIENIMATSISLKNLYSSLMNKKLQKNDVEKITYLIICVKNIRPPSRDAFEFAVTQIIAVRNIKDEFELKRATKFDLKHHRQLLIDLWKALKPASLVPTIPSPAWKEIGFQGNDPATDFRGMGLLGLEQLLYFSTYDTDGARMALSNSNAQVKWYSFAIVGINITGFLKELLVKGKLNAFLYSLENPSLESIHDFYSIVFIKFDKTWTESDARDIMDFGRIFKEFKATIKSQLE